jgi:hypothetical protein
MGVDSEHEDKRDAVNPLERWDMMMPKGQTCRRMHVTVAPLDSMIIGRVVLVNAWQQPTDPVGRPGY